MTLKEKIARAMADRDCKNDRGEGPWSKMPPHIHEWYLDMAEVAIAFFSEPTEAMIEAGGKFLSEQWEGDNWTDPEKRTRWRFEAEDAFNAMINAAKEAE